MDTAFCRIYHVECRGWVQQKRWSLVMLLGLLLLLLASVTVPTIESAVLSSADNLPFGLSDFDVTRTAIVVIGGLVATFLIISVIYWAVPKGHMPWRSVWPGALFFALVTSAGNYIFPLYLNNVSDLHRIGGTIGFILIALVWFYAISLALLAGAVINSLRHEQGATGSHRRYGSLRSTATRARRFSLDCAAWRPLAVAPPHDLAKLRAVVGRLHAAHRSRAGAHHQRLGRRVAIVEVADAGQQVAVRHPSSGEEDVVA